MNDIRERLFRSVDKKGNFLWWEIGVNYGDGTGWRYGLADFSDGAYIGLTENDKAHALTRVVKVH